MLLKFVPPLPDELYCSYIWRLAHVNGIDYKKFCSVYYKKTIGFNKICDFMKIYRHFCAPKLSADEILTRTTTVPVDAICATHKILYKMTGRFYLAFNVDVFAKKYKNFCIECMKEEKVKYGRHFIHRSHNIEGVKVCSKHKTALNYMVETIRVNEIMDADFDINKVTRKYDVLPEDIDLYAKYADFCVDLCESNVCFDIDTVRKCLSERAYLFDFQLYRKVIYDQNNIRRYRKFVARFTESEYFMLKPDFNMFDVTIRLSDIIPIVMFLYDGDSSKFVDDIRQKLDVSNKHLTSEGYDFVSEQKRVFKRYRHIDCGKEYISLNDDYECPYCNNNKSLKQHIAEIQNGEYDLIEDYKNGKIKIRHKECNKILDIDKARFVCGSLRCSCKKANHTKI